MKYKYYTAQMACRDNITRTITIITNAANSLTKGLTVTGCSVSMDSDDDVFTPVRASRGVLSIFCNDSDFSVSDILPLHTTDHRIIISSSNGIEFAGYITHESSSQSYPSNGDSFDIQFVSRLGIAENMPFYPYRHNSDLFPYSQPCFANILSYIFTSLGFTDQDTMTLPLVCNPWKKNGGTSFNCWDELTTGLYQFAHSGEEQDFRIHTYGQESNRHATKTMLDVLNAIASFFACTFREEGNNIVAMVPEATSFVKSDIVDQYGDPWHSDFNWSSISYSAETLSPDWISEGVITYYQPSSKTSVSFDVDTTDTLFEVNPKYCSLNKIFYSPLFRNDNGEIAVYNNTSADESLKCFGNAIIYGNRIVFNGSVFGEISGSQKDFPISSGILFGGYQITSASYILCTVLPKAIYNKDALYLTRYTVSFDMACASIVDNDFVTELPNGVSLSVSFGGNTFTMIKEEGSQTLMKMSVTTNLISSAIVTPFNIVCNGANRMTNYTLIISNIKIHPEKDKESTNSRQYIWHNNSNGEPYEHSVSLCCWHDKIKDFPLNAVYYKTDKDVQGAWYWGKIFDKFFTGTHHTEYDYRDEKYPFPFEVYDMEEYGDHLVDRINTQKSNPYHKLELSVEIGSILKDRLAWVYYFGHEHYQLTGYQRDFLSGIDKLTLTSVEQNTL